MMKRLWQWMVMMVLALSAAAAVAAPASEVPLGTGDSVRISVYGNQDLMVETRVTAAGMVTFPLIGQVSVGGLSVPDAERKIAQLLESGGFVKKPQVNILVVTMQSQQVSVLGQINRPGRYPIDGRRGLLDMLAQAGGIAPDGADTVAVIRQRDGKTTKDVIDVVDMVRGANLASDLELAGGDVLYVERAPRCYIYGEVQRPGPFKLERNMTVLQALSTGGGLTPRGTERGIRIKRRGADGKLQTLEARHDDLLQVDDVVYVQESLF
jgi:polysaccharide export outer membrane protein